MTFDQLHSAAIAACANAYAPYSEFAVGAALLTTAGNVYAGCNVENASYPLSLCAERGAIAAAVAAEGPTMRVDEIVIVTGGGVVAAPCGGCRQVLNEFASGTTVMLAGAEATTTVPLSDLLPLAFGPADLGVAPPGRGSPPGATKG